MKTFIYGILVGAASAYLYVTQGTYVESTLDSLLAWRSSAQTSVHGYGGPNRR